MSHDELLAEYERLKAMAARLQEEAARLQEENEELNRQLRTQKEQYENMESHIISFHSLHRGHTGEGLPVDNQEPYRLH